MIKPQFLNYIRKYDEYYTRYEQVKDIFERYIPVNSLKDKIIYLPCDSEESNFVIYLKQHKDNLQYKELIYTWDDYNTHLDLFEYADIIITNPPFSKMIYEFIPILNKINKDFFIIGSGISIIGYYYTFEDKTIKFIRDDKRFDFITPDNCELSNIVYYVYITNLNINSYYSGKLKFSKDKDKHIEVEFENKTYKNYDKLNDIPEDEYGEILFPITVLLEHNRKYFDIIPNNFGYAKRRYIKYSDNRIRYKRLLVKRKNI